MKNKLLKSIVISIVLTFFSVSSSFAYYNNMPADVVLGQPNFNTNDIATTQTGMDSPIGIFVDPENRLIVTERDNSRVLIWNTVPTENGKPADVVLGQPDFTSKSFHIGATTSRSLSAPRVAFSDGNRLLVTDRNGGRVLIWNTFPTNNYQAADVVVGADDMNGTRTEGCFDKYLSSNGHPEGIWVHENKLLVSDQANDRVLIWNSVPTENGQTADLVLGQPNLTTCDTQDTSSRSIDGPRGITVDSEGRLYVVDGYANRLLIWNTIPTENFKEADIVLGQKDFTSSSYSMTSWNGMATPVGVHTDNGRIFLATNVGHRIMIWNNFPTSNGIDPDIVIGQPDFTSFIGNNGGVSSSSLFYPKGVFVKDNKMYISDDGNNRVLIFSNTLSTPSLWINQLEGISGNREKVSGTVYLGEQGKYAIQRIQAQINGIGYDDVLNKDGGRYDGDGYTLKIKSTSFNGEDDYAFRFTPFSLESVDVSGTQPIFNFFVPIDHINTIRNNVKHFEVLIDDKKYLTNILGDVINSETGKASVSITTDGVTSVSLNLPAGTHSAKIRSVDQWGYYFDSNSVDFESSSGIYSTNGTLTTSSWFPLQINSISGANSAILSSFKPGEILPSYTTVNLNPTIEGIAFANTKITLTVTNADDTTQSTTIQKKTNPDSTFTLSPTLFPNSLISISASDNKGNSTSLPVFKLSR